MSSEAERNTLMGLSKEELLDVIIKLKGDLSKLNEDFFKVTNLRLYHLERNQNLNLQYGHRESFVIVGIPVDVGDTELEDEVIDIAKEAKVSVNRQPLKKSDICAVHRLRHKTNNNCSCCES